MALGIPIVEIPTYEADDVIGTLAQKGRGRRARRHHPDRRPRRAPAGHRAHARASRADAVSATPSSTTSTRSASATGSSHRSSSISRRCKGIRATTSPVFPGIGEKTAMSLVQQYGPLENVLDAVPTMPPGRVQRALEEPHGAGAIEQVDRDDQGRRRRRSAARGCAALPLRRGRGARAVRPPRVPKPARRACPDDASTRSRRLCRRARRNPRRHRRRAADTGNRGRDRRRRASGRRRGASAFAPPGAMSRCAPWSTATRAPAISSASRSRRQVRTSRTTCRCGTRDSSATPIPQRSRRWRSCSSTARIAKRGYDLKRELLAWRRRGIAIQGLQFDALLAAYLDQLAAQGPDAAGARARSVRAAASRPRRSLLGTGRSKRGIADVPIDEAARVLRRLDRADRSGRRGARAGHGARQRDADSTTTMELPLVPILAAMEVEGVAVDCDLLGSISAEMHTRIAEIETRGAGRRRLHVQPREHAAARRVSSTTTSVSPAGARRRPVGAPTPTRSRRCAASIPWSTSSSNGDSSPS